ncbi:MAG: hypothetical protein H6838_04010 [Planctomycetes bacterium]|nr:hypothetical protein [Planctomycetota bacterium]MCB9884631.1 hypothetical protein [Planctomycetota bacterium]
MKYLALFTIVLAACASEAPNTDFDASAGSATVTVAGDGFVDLDGRRMPSEAAVLELRQRTREMSIEDLTLHFVVHVRAGAPVDDDDQLRIVEGINRWLDQLTIMGVKQAAVQ